jgi:hypothetical protein
MVSNEFLKTPVNSRKKKRHDRVPTQLTGATRLLKNFCDGMSSTIWRFRQLEKVLRTRPTRVQPSAWRLRKSIEKLHRLHASLDRELRGKKTFAGRGEHRSQRQ